MRTSFFSYSGPGRHLPSWLRSWPLVTVPLLLAGCQLIGGSGSSPYGAEETEPGSSQGVVYQGFIEIDGGNLPAALEIIHGGGREVRGAFQATSGLMAEGEGRLRGQTLTLELVYGGNCPGRMLLEGEWDQESGTYEGGVEASDCTGTGQGSFRFSAS